MASLSMPAPSRPAVTRDTALRPVPWRKLAWVIWRQHRIALAGVAVLLAGLAGYLLIQGLKIRHAYAAVVACHPASSFACIYLQDDFRDAYWTDAEITAALLLAVPVLIGAFLGAPALARELETGTYRYAWTQGFQRTRWTIGKLATIAVLITAATAALGQLFSWYYQPFIAEGQQSPLIPALFDLSGVAFAAWTLAAFAIGALAGMLTRRVVPAMATTLAIYAGLGFGIPAFLRGHYMTPLTTTSPNISNGNGWVLSQWYTGPGGRPVSQATITQLIQVYQPQTTQISPTTTQTNLDPVGYLAQHGYTQWTSYQPAGRFWPFQLIEGGWLLALSLLLIAATVWLVRHRAA
jgi:ABC-type transport system involved in multi-copper enzyme maturation permease subunit